MIIHWKGKIGYGDIISPICYAINVSRASGRLVELVFHWPYPQTDDYEDISNRAQKIYELLEDATELVNVRHQFNSFMRQNNTNYPFESFRREHRYHNVYFTDWYLPNYWSGEGNQGWREKTIVICDPLNNRESLAAYGAHKAWKDGYTANQWKVLAAQLRCDGYSVVRVNYETPLILVLEYLKKCYHFIGYHGSCSWVARLVGCPMTIISKDDWMSSGTFPWAICESPNVELHRKWSLDKIQWCKNEFERYQLPKLDGLHRS